ncbi:hypothetical protein TBLA_0G00100 [Henningerozyma blattae CBS 6284]|uniref:Uncharacterized protein n=1 Tax=Henningerozyma blattae (strain ATCC 34711 / CBS 6284 / DSM 70876 / NBRC 10599 / NRRL Y-10934 / UCD 77-7) TaxID=1071380 RepID=I2H6G0_HENB6|nr:hypothetical protein TBLA_0G00100 [Tetrapisispora blattae CBS 6284]CCH61962.1 hypothetical protein TBLA_0G00100 [Tetrapisispora blattae CBS 6284]
MNLSPNHAKNTLFKQNKKPLCSLLSCIPKKLQQYLLIFSIIFLYLFHTTISNLFFKLINFLINLFLPVILLFSKFNIFSNSKTQFKNIDLSFYLRYKNMDTSYFERSAISKKILNNNYNRFDLQSYIPYSNISESSHTDNIDDLQLQIYDNFIYYSKHFHHIKSSIKDIKEELLSFEETQNHHDIKFSKNDWKKTSTSSIWLKEEQCYLTVSRLTYLGTNGDSNSNTIIIHSQLFDKNWKELKDKRIPKSNSTLPEDLDYQLKQIENNFTHENCHLFSTLTGLFRSCTKENHRINKEIANLKQKLLDEYYVIYPITYTIPYTKTNINSEDIKLILKQDNDGKEEPIIIFNVNTNNGENSNTQNDVYSFSPHRKSSNIIQFNYPGSTLLNENWTPFFTKEDLDNNKKIETESQNSIHFITGFFPLQILKCSLDDGTCFKEFETKSNKNDNTFKMIQSGTQFVPFPEPIPTLYSSNIWLGFPEYQLQECGCGSQFVRPMMTLMIETNGTYYLELISDTLDFKTPVLSGKGIGMDCSGNNKMSPDSIASWELIGQDPKTKLLEDYLVLTYTEADSRSSMIVLKGLLNYILNMYQTLPITEDKESVIVEHHVNRFTTALGYLFMGFNSYCQEYGQNHKANRFS